MATKPLTPRQRQIFIFIKDYIKKNEYPPVYEDIGKAVGLSSTATVFNHVKALEKKGYIKRLKGISRGLEVLVEDEPEKGSLEKIPVFGKVTGTGPLVESLESQENIYIPGNYIDTSDKDSYFALKVYGDGLVSEGLLDGDDVLFRYDDKPNNGDTVLVQLDSRVATIRRIKKVGKDTNLTSAASPLQNLITRNPNVQGIVKAVFRTY